jgi:hypothetical protein
VGFVFCARPAANTKATNLMELFSPHADEHKNAYKLICGEISIFQQQDYIWASEKKSLINSRTNRLQLCTQTTDK